MRDNLVSASRPTEGGIRRLFLLLLIVALIAVHIASAPASSAAPALYLPYENGTTQTVMQGWNGTYSHNRPSTRYAIDFGLVVGTNVWASAPGTVTRANDFCHPTIRDDDCNGGWGNYVVIEHEPGVCTGYAHLAEVDVKKDEELERGAVLGTSGNSGWSTGQHLDFHRTGCDGVSQPFQFVEYSGSYEDSDITGEPLTSENPGSAPSDPGSGAAAVSTALIIDSSGSMTSSDPENRRLDGARAYVTGSLASDEVGVVDFDSSAEILSEAVEVGSNREMLRERISLIASSGGTNLGAGLQAGCDVLERGTGDARAAIFLTDGVGSYSDQSQCFADNGWQVYVFGLGSGTDEGLLQQIADDTGGEYQHLSDATNLVCEFQQIRAKIGGGTGESCEATGTILQGETIELQPTILGPRLQQATSTNTWIGSDIEMTLTSPSGRKITRDSEGDDLVIDVGPTYETFTIVEPEAGSWGVSLYGADIPDGGEPFTFSTLVIESEVSDTDGDGVPDDEDLFPESDMRDLVFVRDTETDVSNHHFDNGATFNDLIDQASASTRNHGTFVSAVADLTDEWKQDGLISGRESAEINSSAAISKRDR